jgi:hypothetical protein
MKKFMLAFTIFFTITAPSLYADSVGVSGFTSPSIYTYDGLAIPYINNTPLTLNGNIYTTNDSVMRYNNFGLGNCISGQCIGTDTSTGWLDIDLGMPVQKVGGWVGNSSGYVAFFDANDNSIGQVSANPNTNVSMVFAGWDASSGLIGRIRIYDTNNDGHIVTFDNLYTESRNTTVPEPTTMLLLGLGLVGLAGVRRKFMQ